MTEPAFDSQAIASKAVRRAFNLVALPEAAAQAGKVANDPDSTLVELANAFSKDAALCSQLLRVSNSALYGLRCEVSSIEHAANLLGRNVLRNVALAASMQAVMPNTEVHRGFSMKTLWKHSIRTAGAACVLARETGAWNPEEAFAAGLIHDLGILVEIDNDRVGMGKVIALVDGMEPAQQADALRPIEMATFGADHQHFGAAMCEAWGFPKHLRDVAQHHHDPLSLGGQNAKLAALVCLANTVSYNSEHGLQQEREEPPVGDDLLACLGLGHEEFEVLLEAMGEAADGIEASF